MVIWLEFARPRPPERSAGLWLPPCPASLPLLTLLQPSIPYAHPCTPTPGPLPLPFCLHRDILTPMASLEASAPQVLHRHHSPPTLYFTLPYYGFFQSTYHFLTYYQSSISCILYLPHWDVDSWPWAPNSDNRPGVYWCRWCRIRSLGHTELRTALERILCCQHLLEFTSLCQCPPPSGLAERHQHTGL